MLKKFIIFLQLLSVLFCADVLASDLHYSIIVDAGSSGSRLHVFEYAQNDKLPIIHDIFSKKISPGLSSFAEHPEKAAHSLQPLLDSALTVLKQRHAQAETVTLKIMATAGMRLVEPQKARKIYQAIDQYLIKHYSFQKQSLETVPEKMEGLYGWLAVNYLAERFSHTSNQTLGTLDLGGASTEITFATPQKLNQDEALSLTINGKKYTVFSKSFLGLGQDQARLAMDKSSHSFFCYPVNYHMHNGQTGLYQFSNCKKNFRQVIKAHNVRDNIPTTTGQAFIAFSAFYYVAHFFNVEGQADRTTFENRAISECQQSWQQLKAKYPDIPLTFLSHYCASSAFISELLYESYQINDKQITFTNKINGRGIDWTMGALLYSLITHQQKSLFDN